ncbi:MAG: hypothetical protein PVH84_01480 [Candidatus Aminicenantes bacterium]
MAKTKMICPFSGKVCEECPLYKGRHYYLCFAKKYRGYLGGGEDKAPQMKSPVNVEDTHTVSEDYRLPIPPPLKPSPTWLAFNDYPDRKNK